MATDDPKTLQQAILYFADYENCHQAVANIRWPDGVVAARTCGSEQVTYLENAPPSGSATASTRTPQFSLKVGTIFEDSPIRLAEVAARAVAARQLQERHQQLRAGAARLASPRRPRGSCSRAFGSRCRTRTAARSAASRSRRNLHRRQGPQHARASASAWASRRVGRWRARSRSWACWSVTARTASAASACKSSTAARRVTCSATCVEHVEAGSTVYTDALPLLSRARQADYVHDVIDHAEAYVDGNVHTNGLRKLLVAAEARDQWHLRERRTVPSVPLPRRAGVPFQRAQAD